MQRDTSIASKESCSMTAAGETVFALHNLDNWTKRYLHLEFHSKRFQRFFLSVDLNIYLDLVNP